MQGISVYILEMPRLDKMTSDGCRRFNIIAWGLAAGLMLPTAVILWRDSMGAGEMSSRVSSAATVVVKRGYFRRGQWRADARTLAAAARWCFQPEFPASGSAVYSNGVPVVAPTNAVTVTRT